KRCAGSHCDPVAVDDGDHAERNGFAPGVLMDLRLRESCETAFGVEPEDERFVDARTERDLCGLLELIAAELAHPRTPTCTLRKRAGAVPCATRAVCGG